MLRNITLSPGVNDEIKWKWTSNDEYSAASAYKIQFQGSHTPFQIGKLWKARVESGPSSRTCYLCARTGPPKFKGPLMSVQPISLRFMCISPKPRIKALNSIPYQCSRS
jgi:hypothetical protein